MDAPVAKERAEQGMQWAGAKGSVSFEPEATSRGELLSRFYAAVQDQPDDVLNTLRAPAAQ